MRYKLITFLFLFILAVQFGSALDFDNVKTFNPNKPIKGEIVIENNFGLGSELAKYTLTDHSDQCLIDCYSEGTAVFYSNDKLFRDVKFYNKYNTRKNPNYQILIKEDVLYTWTEKTYQTQCSVVTNGTGSGNVCNQVENGTISKSETRKEWRPYDGRILSSGSYEWRIEAKKGGYESIDWVGESFGVVLNEWAWWNSSWSRSKQISNLTGSITQVWIPKAAEMNTTGTDLRFTNLANTTEINFTFVPINSTGQYWNTSGFMVRLYNDGVDKVLMYYGNSFSSLGSNASKVYGNSFISYWAFEEVSGTTVYDLFGKANGTIGSTTGRLFGNFSQAINFTGTGSNVSWLSDHYARNHLNVSGKFGQFILGKLYANSYYGFQQDCGTAADAACLAIQSNLYDSNPSRPVIYQAGNGNAYSGSDNGFVLNSWLTMTIWGGSATAQYSINGVNKTLADYNGNDKNANSHPMYLGARVNGGATSKATTDEFGVYTAMLSLKEISNLANQTYSTAVYGNEMFENTLLVTNNHPENGGLFTRSNVHFNATATDDTAVLNITLFIDNVANQTFYNTTANQATLSFNVTKYLADGAHTWRAEAYDNSGATYASTNYSFTVDTVAPVITITSPTNNGYIYSINSTYTSFILNATATDTSPISAIWYNSTWNSSFIYFTNSVISYVNVTNIFGKQTLYVYGNDTIGNLNYQPVNITLHRSYFNNRTGFETENQTLSLELWNQTSAPTNGVLNYNGTNYTATITDVGNNKYTLNTTLDIPTGTDSKNFRWFWNGSSSDIYYQTINGTYFVSCNSTIAVPYLNVSFKNETTGTERVTASIASSEFIYYLGSGTSTKTYTYSSLTENLNYTFCASPSTLPLNINETISYANSYSAQRTYSNNTILNATLSQQTLYLLPNNLGIYVTFQVINPALQPISGVEVAISSSVFGNVETKTTDDAGAATFFLNPLITYSLVATKDGLPTYSTTITPTQSEYSITMGLTSTNISIQDYFRGITYSILPGNNYLSNGTTYNFNFTVNSQYWNLDEFGFYLSNGTTNFGSTSSSSSTGGTVTLNKNTGDNNTLILNAYWVIEGNYTNVSKTYIVYDSSGSDTSLANLSDRIRIYIDAGGFFGLTAFGLNILVFLTIFITTGLLSYKFGFTSPFAVLAVMLGFTMLFDYLNFITYASALPEDAASILIGILVVGFGIKEATQ